MFKSTIFTILLPLVALISAPVASAGPYCNALGGNPSLDTAQQVLWEAVVDGVDATVFATDIVDNCRQNYGIIMQAGEAIRTQLKGQ
jgi:hypothetical protein